MSLNEIKCYHPSERWTILLQMSTVTEVCSFMLTVPALCSVFRYSVLSILKFQTPLDGKNYSYFTILPVLILALQWRASSTICHLSSYFIPRPWHYLYLHNFTLHFRILTFLSYHHSCFFDVIIIFELASYSTRFWRPSKHPPPTHIHRYI